MSRIRYMGCALSNNIPTEEQMLAAGAKVLKDGKKCYFYIDKSGFWMTKAENGLWVSDRSRNPKPFENWLWENFRCYFLNDISEKTFIEKRLGISFAGIWEDMTEEERTTAANFEIYHQILENDFLDEYDTIRDFHVDDHVIKRIYRKYFFKRLKNFFGKSKPN